MSVTLAGKLVVGISSRALFDLEASNALFEQEGLEAYRAHQIQAEHQPLEPGVAFPLIQRLLNLRFPSSHEPVVEVILISRNDTSTGLRVFNAIEAHDLRISRAAFTSGRPAYSYLQAFGVDLFLSAHPEDVRLALDQGQASATILTGLNLSDDPTEEIRIAFDGDSVLFSDEAERVYQQQGLAAFNHSETLYRDQPLEPGPFKPFLEALHAIQRTFQAAGRPQPFRTALVTARSAPAHGRVVKTLRHWGIQVDEAFFLGGLDKAAILASFRPHIFFDDQPGHCELARQVVPTGHVPAGVVNQSLGGKLREPSSDAE